MKLILETPTKARVLTDSNEELSELKKILTYTNSSVAYQIKMTKDSAVRFGQDWAAGRLLELEQKLKETILYQDKNGYYTRPGLLNYIRNRLDIEFENQIEYPEFKLIPWHHEPEYAPHKWQSEALNALINAKHAHIEAVTGAGKSLLIELLAKTTGLPTVICTPSASIARSMYEECKDMFGKQKVGLFGDTKRELGKHILIAIGKSLSLVKDPEELNQFKKYQIFVGDESHQMPADSLDHVCNEVLGHCPYRWFVSGTQERSDGRDLKLLSIIGPQVYNYSNAQATKDGVLAKLRFLMIDVASRSFFESQNLKRMYQKHVYEDTRIAQVIADLTHQAVKNNMPVLILIDEHAQEKLLQAHMKVEYAYACGKSKTHLICDDFNAGKIMCVVGTSAVSTGTNFKPVQLTINWQCGKSSVKFKQGCIGRSTRIDKRTGKNSCSVVDFRITNVPVLKRHGNERLGFYKEIVESYEPAEEIQFVTLDEVFKQMTTAET